MTANVAIAIGLLVALSIAGFVFVWRTALPVEPEKPEKPEPIVVEKTTVEKTVVFFPYRPVEDSTTVTKPGDVIKWKH